MDDGILGANDGRLPAVHLGGCRRVLLLETPRLLADDSVDDPASGSLIGSGKLAEELDQIRVESDARIDFARG